MNAQLSRAAKLEPVERWHNVARHKTGWSFGAPKLGTDDDGSSYVSMSTLKQHQSHARFIMALYSSRL